MRCASGQMQRSNHRMAASLVLAALTTRSAVLSRTVLRSNAPHAVSFDQPADRLRLMDIHERWQCSCTGGVLRRGLRLVCCVGFACTHARVFTQPTLALDDVGATIHSSQTLGATCGRSTGVPLFLHFGQDNR